MKQPRRPAPPRRPRKAAPKPSGSAREPGLVPDDDGVIDAIPRMEMVKSHMPAGASDSGSAAPAREADTRELTARFGGRPLIVLVGMHRSGASVVAKMLQLLGVDMADASGDWERPEIAAFNDRLLAAIGRPLLGPLHALPFPPGWWGEPQVQAIKREAQAYLRDTLRDLYGLWGFKDLRVTRLLPFWQQIFDEMGLKPLYVWAVRDPAECAASAVASGLVRDARIAEAMWFIYNADAHKYVGDAAVAIVDYAAWGEDPARVVDMLLGGLPLSWRGSRTELLECLRAITPETRGHTASSPIHSPLVQAFYEAIRDPDRAEKSLRTRDSVAQAVDILRTLVAPFAALAGMAPRQSAELAAPVPAADPEPDSANSIDEEMLAPLLARAEEAEAAVRETAEALSAALARVAEAEAARERAEAEETNSRTLEQALDAMRARAEHAEAARREGEEALRAAAARAETARREIEEPLAREIDERIAENGWLQQQFLDQKRALALLEEQRDTATSRMDGELERVREVIEAQRGEIAQRKDMNTKYLSRIYALKAGQRADDAEPATSA